MPSTMTVTTSNYRSGFDDDEYISDDILARKEDDTRQLYWIQWFFLFFGIGVLIPWNAFMAAIEYFERRFCPPNTNTISSTSSEIIYLNQTIQTQASDGSHSVQANLESILAIVFNLSSVFTLSTLLLYQSVCAHHRSHRRSTNSKIETSQINYQKHRPKNSIDANHQHDEHGSDHSFWMVYVPLLIFVIAFGVQAAFVLWVPTTSLTTEYSFELYIFPIVTLICVILCGACITLAQSGIVAIAGSFPAHIGMSQFVQGCAIGGVAVSFANIIAASWEDPTPYHTRHCSNSDGESKIEEWELLGSTDTVITDNVEIAISTTDTCIPYTTIDWGVFFYFVLGSLVLISCMFGFSYIQKYRDSKLKEGQHCIVVDQKNINCFPQCGAGRHNDYETVRSHDGLIDDSDANDPTAMYYHAKNLKLESDRIELVDILDQEDCNSVCRITNMPHMIEESNSAVASKADDDDYNDDESQVTTTITRDVWKTTKGPIICIFLTFFVSLSLYPAWTSQLRSIHQCSSPYRIFNDLYVPFTFVLFNVGDLIGRNLAGRLPIRKLSRLSSKLVYLSAARLIFFPLLLLCAGGSPTSPFAMIRIPSDIYSICVQLLLGITNGMLISASYISSSLLLHQSHGKEEKYNDYQERMSEMLNLALSIGLFGGSSFSYVVVQVANSGLSKS